MFPPAMEKKDKQLWNFIRKQNARKIDNYICERNYNICIHYRFKYDFVGVDRWTDKSSKYFM